eukprot:TRINITY_DN51056_c0_g1_i2.p3 TRINITY_DN51056_c0_g1~~TRINITY_DN51056_c0_g1_i2.p3  ORF type:complete len:100 (+),score=10.74 TRINITY_DN51056_c0_g1_i2:179-478(+)
MLAHKGGARGKPAAAGVKQCLWQESSALQQGIQSARPEVDTKSASSGAKMLPLPRHHPSSVPTSNSCSELRARLPLGSAMMIFRDGRAINVDRDPGLRR